MSILRHTKCTCTEIACHVCTLQNVHYMPTKTCTVWETGGHTEPIAQGEICAVLNTMFLFIYDGNQQLTKKII